MGRLRSPAKEKLSIVRGERCALEVLLVVWSMLRAMLGKTKVRVRPPLLLCLPGFDSPSEGCRTVNVGIEWGAKRSVKTDNSTLPAQLYWLRLPGSAALPQSNVHHGKLRSIIQTRLFGKAVHLARQPLGWKVGYRDTTLLLSSGFNYRCLVATKDKADHVFPHMKNAFDLRICHVSAGSVGKFVMGGGMPNHLPD